MGGGRVAGPARGQSLFGAATTSLPNLAFTTPAGLIYRDFGHAWLFRIGALLGLGAAAGMAAVRERRAAKPEAA